jgi:hypothetical protein
MALAGVRWRRMASNGVQLGRIASNSIALCFSSAASVALPRMAPGCLARRWRAWNTPPGTIRGRAALFGVGRGYSTGRRHRRNPSLFDAIRRHPSPAGAIRACSGDPALFEQRLVCLGLEMCHYSNPPAAFNSQPVLRLLISNPPLPFFAPDVAIVDVVSPRSILPSCPPPCTWPSPAPPAPPAPRPLRSAQARSRKPSTQASPSASWRAATPS